MIMTNTELYLEAHEIFEAFKDSGSKTPRTDTSHELSKRHGPDKGRSSKMLDGLKKHHGLPDRKRAIRNGLDVFFAGAIPRDTTGYRDVWYYALKHIVQVYQYPTQDDGKFSDAITSEVSQVVWEMFLDGDKHIYSRIGIHSSHITHANPWQLDPILFFIEKDKRDFRALAKKIDCSYYVSQGQSNKYELALLAKSFITGITSNYDGTVYVFSVGDYDPAGLEIRDTLNETFFQCLQVFDPDVELVHHHVDYSHLTSVYDTYLVSAGMIDKDVWDGSRDGLELNVIPYDVRMQLLYELLDGKLPKSFLEGVAKRKQMILTKSTILADDKKYQNAITKAEKRETKLLKKASKLKNYDFDENRINAFFTGHEPVSDFSTYLKKK